MHIYKALHFHAVDSPPASFNFSTRESRFRAIDVCELARLERGTICTICRNCLRYPPDCPEDLCQCYKAESPTRAAPARIQDELSAEESNSLGKGKLSSLAALLLHGQQPVYPNAPVYSVIVA